MFSGRTILLLAAVAGGYWLWTSGKWEDLAARVPMLAERLGQGTTADGTHTGGAVAHDSAGQAPAAGGSVRTWVDANGVRHFASAAAAPEDSTLHQGKALGTMSEYEQAVQEETGLRPQDIARAEARQTALQAQAQAAQQQASLPTANLAIQQIEEAKQQSGGVQASMQQAVERTRTLVKPE